MTATILDHPFLVRTERHLVVLTERRASKPARVARIRLARIASWCWPDGGATDDPEGAQVRREVQ